MTPAQRDLLKGLALAANALTLMGLGGGFLVSCMAQSLAWALVTGSGVLVYGVSAFALAWRKAGRS